MILSGNGKPNSQPLPWALKYFATLTWETVTERYVQASSSPSPWPFSWDCQQMIAEHLPDSSNFQSPVYNNAKSVFCCQPLVYNNAKSVFCCWNVLFIMGHVQITWMWSYGDAHQLICQKLPHKGAICHTGNMWFMKSPFQTKMQVGLF